MKRAAFTMIELIFVIVILGILAAVAIPKLAGVQDDALVSSEKTGIASARSGTAAIRGRALSRPGQLITISTTSIAGVQGSITYDTNTTPGNPDSVSSSKYPQGISVDGITNGGGDNAVFAASEGTGFAMAAVLQPEGRESWSTNAEGNTTQIAGPATLTVVDSTVELNNLGRWIYDPVTGIFAYQSATAYVAP